MNFLSDFIDEVRKGSSQFSIKGASCGLFARIKYGMAEFIVGCTGFNNIELNGRTNFTVYAVVSGGEIILYKSYEFDPKYILHDKGTIEGMPDVKFIIWKLDEMNAKITEECYKPWYDALPTEEYELTADDIDMLRRRELGLISPNKKKPQWIDESTLVAFMTGEIEDINAYVLEYKLETRRESYIANKAVTVAEEEYCKNNDLVKDWEQNLLDTLSTECPNAKYLNVTFERNGLCSTGKVSQNTIISVLASNGRFDEYSFNTKLEGKRVCSELSVYGYKNELKFSDITEISYGKKVLWNR